MWATYSKILHLALWSLVLIGEVQLASRMRPKRLSSPSRTIDKYLLAKYVVSIRSRVPRAIFGDDHFCAGSIISPLFVLTAATCVMGRNKVLMDGPDLCVVAGAPNRLEVDEGITQIVPVQHVFVTKTYFLQNTNNIAILKLLNRLHIGRKSVDAIRLPTENPKPGLKYVVLGFGRQYKNGPLAGRMNYINITLLNNTYCAEKIENFMPEMLCAGNLNSTLDESPCEGDVGDPFLLNKTIYGIATYGLGCGQPGFPSVYTNVWYELRWIKHIMRNNRCWKSFLMPDFRMLLFNTLISKLLRLMIKQL